MQPVAGPKALADLSAMTLTAWCVDCQQPVEIRRSTITPPRWKRPDRQSRTEKKLRWHRQGRDGRIYVRCRTCAAKRNGELARRASLEQIIDARASYMLSHGGPETDGDRLLLAALSATKRKLNQAGMLVDHIDLPAVQTAVAALRTEVFLRKLGDGDVELGRRERARRGPSNTAAGRAAQQEAQRLGRGHPGMITGAAARLTGLFSLCPLCWLVLYRASTPTKRSDGRSWHGACRKAWAQHPQVRLWTGMRSKAILRGTPMDVLPDFPMPPAAPAKVAGALAAGYRGLMGQRRGLSVASLGEIEGVSRQAMQQKVQYFEDRLPGSWALVFGPAARGLHTRQQLCSLPMDSLGQRAAAAKRMASIGVAAETILQVTGVAIATAVQS